MNFLLELLNKREVGSYYVIVVVFELFILSIIDIDYINNLLLLLLFELIDKPIGVLLHVTSQFLGLEVKFDLMLAAFSLELASELGQIDLGLQLDLVGKVVLRQLYLFGVYQDLS